MAIVYIYMCTFICVHSLSEKPIPAIDNVCSFDVIGTYNP